MQDEEVQPIGNAGDRRTEATLGIILRVPVEQVEDLEAKLTSLGPRVIYVRWSFGKLWVVDEPPKRGKP